MADFVDLDAADIFAELEANNSSSAPKNPRPPVPKDNKPLVKRPRCAAPDTTKTNHPRGPASSSQHRAATGEVTPGVLLAEGEGRNLAEGLRGSSYTPRGSSSARVPLKNERGRGSLRGSSRRSAADGSSSPSASKGGSTSPMHLRLPFHKLLDTFGAETVFAPTGNPHPTVKTAGQHGGENRSRSHSSSPSSKRRRLSSSPAARGKSVQTVEKFFRAARSPVRSVTRTFPFLDLPELALRHTLSYLSLEEVLKVSETCKTCYTQVFLENKLWFGLFSSVFRRMFERMVLAREMKREFPTWPPRLVVLRGRKSSVCSAGTNERTGSTSAPSGSAAMTGARKMADKTKNSPDRDHVGGFGGFGAEDQHAAEVDHSSGPSVSSLQEKHAVPPMGPGDVVLPAPCVSPFHEMARQKNPNRSEELFPLWFLYFRQLFLERQSEPVVPEAEDWADFDSLMQSQALSRKERGGVGPGTTTTRARSAQSDEQEQRATVKALVASFQEGVRARRREKREKEAAKQASGSAGPRAPGAGHGPSGGTGAGTTPCLEGVELVVPPRTSRNSNSEEDDGPILPCEKFKHSWQPLTRNAFHQRRAVDIAGCFKCGCIHYCSLRDLVCEFSRRVDDSDVCVATGLVKRIVFEHETSASIQAQAQSLAKADEGLRLGVGGGGGSARQQATAREEQDDPYIEDVFNLGECYAAGYNMSVEEARKRGFG